MGRIILQTERTIVSCITLADAAFFVTLLNSPGWLKNIGNRNVGSIEDARQYLEDGFLKSYRDHDFGYHIVRTHDLAPIGICGFLKKPDLDNPDFGFALLPDYCGQGFAFESSSAVLNHGIQTFGFSVLDAVVKPDNGPSIRLLEKLGFLRHGAIQAVNDGDHLQLYRWRQEE